MKIFITGVQRGGTHFLANYLSKKYNLKYIDEKDFDYTKLNKLLDLVKDNCVVQCPCIKTRVLELKKLYPDCIIIWLHRNLLECVQSMEKIGWKKSALQEIERLKEVTIVEESENIYTKVVLTSLKLGLTYFREGVVDNLINMKSLEKLKGFKKNQGRVGLC